MKLLTLAEAEAWVAAEAHDQAEKADRKKVKLQAERTRRRPMTITEAPEHRGFGTADWELRAQGGTLHLKGYASTFEPYEMYGGPAAGGWIEQIDRHAFDKTLREKPDLHLLINHEGMPLARTKSGTLQLSVDNHGLLVEAELDRSDPDVQALEVKMRRGDMDEMSFAFRIKLQKYSAAVGFEGDVTSHRLIQEVSLHKGDVSVVNFGANDTTHAELKTTKRSAAAAVLRRRAALMDREQRASDAAKAAAEKMIEQALQGLARLRADEAEAGASLRSGALHDSVRSAGDLRGSRTPAQRVSAAAVGVDEFTETEQARRAAVDAEIEQLQHRYSVLSALGKAERHGLLADEIRDRTAAETKRRQRADTELEQLKRHSSTVQAVGRGGNPLPTIASRR